MISVTVLVFNDEDKIEKCLEALSGFAEVVVLDTGSKDLTKELALQFPNVRLFSSPFIGFGPLHNLATSYATYDWILSIDSDEVLSKEAFEELQGIKLDLSNVYLFSRWNFFGGKRITTCGWHSETIARMFCRLQTQFSEDLVHEKVLIKNLKSVLLKGPIFHYSYRTIDDFLIKMKRYADLFVEQNQGRKKSSLLKAVLKSWAAFFRSYILKKGFLGGSEGYMISRYNADVAYYKYLKLAYSKKID
jgi:glycosyltransferase involved in cell wall biosynthesis